MSTVGRARLRLINDMENRSVKPNIARQQIVVMMYVNNALKQFNMDSSIDEEFTLPYYFLIVYLWWCWACCLRWRQSHKVQRRGLGRSQQPPVGSPWSSSAPPLSAPPSPGRMAGEELLDGKKESGVREREDTLLKLAEETLCTQVKGESKEP